MSVLATTRGTAPDPWREDAVRLAIVGSRRFKNLNAYAIALPHLTIAATVVAPDQILSGGADGMDLFAAAFAQSALIPCREFRPKTRNWGGPGGFQERNEEIARTCTHLLAVRCEQSATFGSGWTADRAEALGRKVVRVTIPAQGLVPVMVGSWS